MDLLDPFLQQDLGVGQVRYLGRQELDNLLVLLLLDLDLIDVDLLAEVASPGELGTVPQDEAVDVGQARGHLLTVYHKRMFIEFHYFCHLPCLVPYDLRKVNWKVMRLCKYCTFLHIKIYLIFFDKMKRQIE